MVELEINSENEMNMLGVKISSVLQKGDILCLDGDLGCGKTLLTKAIAKAIGINDEVTSPTFNIVNTYEDGRVVLHHFDVYRIKNIYEMYDIGYEEYFYDDAICIIEWSKLIKEIIPNFAKTIEIFKDESKGINYRKIIINGIQL